MLLEVVNKIRVNTEQEAKAAIEEYNEDAHKKGYYIKKASYEYKAKKAKGEVVAEVWVVTIDSIYNDLWEGLI